VAAILKVENLAERKRALAEESELYRQMLHVQIRNAQLYSLSVREKFRGFNKTNPLLMLAVPLLIRFIRGSLVKRSSPFGKFRVFGTVMAVLPVARRILPVIFKFVARQRSKKRAQREMDAESAAAAI
jgi:hypothetical protein